MAARLAYKAGIPQANPCILEPMGMMKVYVPDSCMGDVIGDLNKRRGRILGMNPTEGGEQEVVAYGGSWFLCHYPPLHHPGPGLVYLQV